jgi:3-deoxy-D-manno-octulosonic-acid transferase
MRWLVYNAVFAVVYAAMMPKFLLRMKKRGGYKEHFMEWFGRYSPELARRLAEKKRIWIHAVSVGEANVAGLVVKELRRRNPDASFVISTTSSTGRAVVEKLASDRDVVIYLPLDFPPCVRRAVTAINASALVLAESEFWPNLLRALHRRGVPLVLVNGRVSDRSAPGYRKARFFFGPVFKLFREMLVQSPLDANRLVAAGADVERIEVSGSLKFDVAPPSAEMSEKARSILSRCGVMPGEGRILLGGSTWPGEEIALAKAWRTLEKEFQGLRLVLVPRHAERANEIVSELSGASFEAVLASQCLARPPDAPYPDMNRKILVVDATGVLFPLYGFADVVFVGKSLAPNEGGQNMIEPCALGKAVICGPHTENFVPAMQVLRKGGAIAEVRDADELSSTIGTLLRDAGRRDALGKAAGATVASSRGALAKTADAIERILENRR